MDGIVDFIVSVNKISLIAFLGVLGFLVYEISLLRKEQLKKQKPSIPQFNTNAVIDKTVVQQQAAAVAVVPKKTEVKHVKTSPVLILVLVIMIVLFLGFSAYTVITRSKEPVSATPTPTVFIQEISSAGLKVFDESWNEVLESNIHTLKGGVKVYIGIQNIAEADIDRARIKINEKEWNIGHITNKFNGQKNVYYREYTIATGESQLKIDAQLHSETDGWLGD
jgi:hypothetical protein